MHARDARALVVAWELAPAPIPSLRDVFAALAALWTERGLYDALATSFALNVEAIAWSTALTLALAYLTVIPAVRPLVAAVSKLRFTSMVGWGFVLALAHAMAISSSCGCWCSG